MYETTSYDFNTHSRLSNVIPWNLRREIPCESEVGEAIGAVDWIMNTARRVLEALAH